MTTVRQVLFRHDKDQQQAAKRLAKVKGVRRRKEPRLELICHTALSHPAMMIDIEVIDMFCAAWRDSSSLRLTARETAAQPGLKRRVKLGYYYLPWHHDWDADFYVNGMLFASVPMSLELELGVTDLDATIAYGRLEMIGGGRGVVKVGLAAHGVTLLQTRLRVSLKKEVIHAANPSLL